MTKPDGIAGFATPQVRRLRVRWLAVTLCCAALTACGQPLPSFRYKMTLVVDTPEGPRTGSAVRELTAYKEPHFLPDAGGTSVNISGEGAVVHLPGGKMLIALLASDQMGASAPELGERLRDAVPGRPRGYEALAKALSKGVYKVQLPRQDYPILVTFADAREPETIEAVTPETASSILGDGVRIREIDLESTREPVTRRIETDLPWLGVWNPNDSVPLQRGLPALPTRPAQHDVSKSDFTTG